MHLFNLTTVNWEHNPQISAQRHRNGPSPPHTSDFLSRYCSGLDFSLDYRLGTVLCSFHSGFLRIRQPACALTSGLFRDCQPAGYPAAKVASQREICRCHPPLAEAQPWQRDTPSPSHSRDRGTHLGLPLPRG